MRWSASRAPGPATLGDLWCMVRQKAVREVEIEEIDYPRCGLAVNTMPRPTRSRLRPCHLGTFESLPPPGHQVQCQQGTLREFQS